MVYDADMEEEKARAAVIAAELIHLADKADEALAYLDADTERESKTYNALLCVTAAAARLAGWRSKRRKP